MLNSNQAPMNRTQRRQRAQMLGKLKTHIAKHGVESVLSRIFGPGSYTYDAQEKLWIVPNHKYTGPGKEFYCVNAQGDWFMANLPDSRTQ
jgi:hypothetical protein